MMLISPVPAAVRIAFIGAGQKLLVGSVPCDGPLQPSSATFCFAKHNVIAQAMPVAGAPDGASKIRSIRCCFAKKRMSNPVCGSNSLKRCLTPNIYRNSVHSVLHDASYAAARRPTFHADSSSASCLQAGLDND
jgi:hypothetical protein